MPAGNFLLPVCTNRENLRKTLSILHFGVWEAGFGDDYAATLDILNALAFLDDPTNAPCYPTPAPLFVAELPNGFSRSNGALCIDMRRINVDINIIQEATFCGDHSGGGIDTSNFLKSEGGGGVSAIDINNLQQQIDALQNAVDALESDTSQRDAAIADYKQSLVGSIRWQSGGAFPLGWAPLDGGLYWISDYPLLAERTPPSWRQWVDEPGGLGWVALPNIQHFAPFTSDGTADGIAAGIAFGESRDVWVDDNQPTGGKRITAMRGRWLIYVGE